MANEAVFESSGVANDSLYRHRTDMSYKPPEVRVQHFYKSSSFSLSFSASASSLTSTADSLLSDPPGYSSSDIVEALSSSCIVEGEMIHTPLSLFSHMLTQVEDKDFAPPQYFRFKRGCNFGVPIMVSAATCDDSEIHD